MSRENPLVLFINGKDCISAKVFEDNDDAKIFDDCFIGLIREFKKHVQSLVIVISADEPVSDENEKQEKLRLFFKKALVRQVGVSEVSADGDDQSLVLHIRFDQVSKYELLREIYTQYSPAAEVMFHSSYIESQMKIEQTNTFREVSETNYRYTKYLLCEQGDDVVPSLLKQKLEQSDYKSTIYTVEEIRTINRVLKNFKHVDGVPEVLKQLEKPSDFELHYAFRKLSEDDVLLLDKLLLGRSWLDEVYEKIFSPENGRSISYDAINKLTFSDDQFVNFCNFLNCPNKDGRRFFDKFVNNHANEREFLLENFDWMELQKIKNWLTVLFKMLAGIRSKFEQSRKSYYLTLLFNYEIIFLRNFLNIPGSDGAQLVKKIDDKVNRFHSYSFDAQEGENLLNDAVNQDGQPKKEIHIFLDVDDTSLLYEPSRVLQKTIVNPQIICLLKKIKDAKLHILTAREKFDPYRPFNGDSTHVFNLVSSLNQQLIEVGSSLEVDRSDVYCLGEGVFENATKWQFIYEHVIKHHHVHACLIDDSYMQMGRISTLHALAKEQLEHPDKNEKIEIDHDAVQRISRICVRTCFHQSCFDYQTMTKQDSSFHKSSVEGYLKSRLEASARSEIASTAVVMQGAGVVSRDRLFNLPNSNSVTSTSGDEYMNELFGDDAAFGDPVCFTSNNRMDP